MADFVGALKRDLVEQFKGKPNIEALLEVISIELQQVYDFYAQLRNNRDVFSSVGKQLDGVGDIVVLSRMEAGILAGNPIPFEVMGDDMYRQYLIFKILKNTSNCTYPDIIKAFRMFWKYPLYYREDPSEPATMIFDTGEITADINVAPLVSVPLLRAAGVTLTLMIWIKCRTDATLHIGTGIGSNAALGVREQPDVFRFSDKVRAGSAENGTRTLLNLPEDTAAPHRVSILRTGGSFVMTAPVIFPTEEG